MNHVATRVNIMTASIDNSIQFYSETLGLELTARYGDHYAEIKTSNFVIGIHPSSGKTIVGNNMSIGFGVSDFDETIKELEEKGIALTIEKDAWIRLAYFQDPDHNELFIAERK